MLAIRFFVDGEKIREIKIKLAEEDPDFWVFLDISEFKVYELSSVWE